MYLLLLRFVSLSAALCVCLPAFANDAVISVGAGGILLGSEPRIEMRREKLRISAEKVVVEYEFVNDTDEDVTTPVAFPLPPYTFDMGPGGGAGSKRTVDNFVAWANDKPIALKRNVGAFVSVSLGVGGVGPPRDVLPILKKYGISVEDLGGFDKPNNQYIVPRLGSAAIEELKRSKIIFDEANDLMPAWYVSIAYHWIQRFPPRSTTRIKHEYVPAFGYSISYPGKHLAAGPRDGCLEPRTLAALQKESRVGPHSVDYILTTANTWKTPIKDFELIVERKDDEVVTFCWDGPVEKIGPGLFSAKVKDFVPKSELEVIWYRIERRKRQ